MSKQLALSIAVSVMTMSAFALSMSPLNSVSNISKHSNGAIAEATAPSVFSVFTN